MHDTDNTPREVDGREDADRRRLRRALDLAARGPEVDPNPRVGAVLVTPAGQVAGEGWHDGAGSPHAEVQALQAAGAAARGATAYVSLEPCNHHGRTGPCAEALLAAGVGRVVFAQPDPNPLAAGGGARLAEAGVEVSGGLLADEAEALNADWSFAVRAGRPRVVWKFAATLDGRAAAADGTSQWITGPEARSDGHVERGRCGAVLVGTGTVLADDPHLTARPGGALMSRQPLRVVLGERTVPQTARVRDAAAPTLLLRHRDPVSALHALHERGVRRVWLEGGPTVAAAFWRVGLVDEVVAYLAPALLGAGPAAVADLGIGSIGEIARLRIRELRRVGDDLKITAEPDTSELGDPETAAPDRRTSGPSDVSHPGRRAEGTSDDSVRPNP